MEYHGKFGHTLEQIQHIAIMRRIDIFDIDWSLGTQTVAPIIPCFQGLKSCIQYLASHPYKIIFYPYNYCYGSNVIRLIWSGNQVKYYTTWNHLEPRQDKDCVKIINRRRSVSGVINNLLGSAVWSKVHIQPDIASDLTDG